MKDFKVLLFDLGGVLVELVGVPTMLEWTGNRYSESELWRVWLESPTVRAFETGRIGSEQFGSAIVDELEMSVSAEQFIAAFTYWPAGLFEGVPELLEQLRTDYKVACLSNTNTLHWPRLMNEMGLDSLFDQHFASHLIGELKPDVACFDHVLHGLGCDAADVLFFDDNEINVQSARALGMQAECVKSPADVRRFLSLP